MTSAETDAATAQATAEAAATAATTAETEAVDAINAAANKTPVDEETRAALDKLLEGKLPVEETTERAAATTAIAE